MKLAQALPGFEMYPEGFQYVPEFLSEKEESVLMGHITRLPFKPFEFYGWEAKRQSVSFGFDYSFSEGRVHTVKPIPEFLLPLRKKIAKHLALDPKDVVEAGILLYPKGSAIGWHRDVLNFEVIAGVTLRASAEFRLRPYVSEKRKSSQVITLTVEPRSLYVLKGASRYDFQHSISPVEEERCVINFRTLQRKFNR